MSLRDIYNRISDNYQYENMNKWNPLKAAVIWANTNSKLDEFYNRPEINLDNSDRDNAIRNTMRHMVGLGITAREYNPYIARRLGVIKENYDMFTHLDFFDNLTDSKKDIINNELGINYMVNNPNASDEDLIKYSYNIAKNGYEIPRSNGYKNFINHKPITLYGYISKTD